MFWLNTGLFYFTLGNISPKLRSKLSSIQLVSIVKCTVLKKYGMNAVLRPFVEDVKKLVSPYLLYVPDYFLPTGVLLCVFTYTICTSMILILFQESGHCCEVQGESSEHFGTLVLNSADNLGAYSLGGFTESSSTYRFCRGFKESSSTYRFCRQCLVTHETKNQVCYGLMKNLVHIMCNC